MFDASLAPGSLRVTREIHYTPPASTPAEPTISNPIRAAARTTLETVWTPDAMFGTNHGQFIRRGARQVARRNPTEPWTLRQHGFGRPETQPTWLDPEWLFQVLDELDPTLRHVEPMDNRPNPMARATASLSRSQIRDFIGSGAAPFSTMATTVHSFPETMWGTIDLCFEFDPHTKQIQRIEARIAQMDAEVHVGNSSFRIILDPLAIRPPDTAPGFDSEAQFEAGFPIHPERDAHRFAYIWRFSRYGESPPFELDAKSRRLLGN